MATQKGLWRIVMAAQDVERKDSVSIPDIAAQLRHLAAFIESANGWTQTGATTSGGKHMLWRAVR